MPSTVPTHDTETPGSTRCLWRVNSGAERDVRDGAWAERTEPSDETNRDFRTATQTRACRASSNGHRSVRAHPLARMRAARGRERQRPRRRQRDLPATISSHPKQTVASAVHAEQTAPGAD